MRKRENVTKIVRRVMAEIVTNEARVFKFCPFLLIVMRFESLSRRLSQFDIANIKPQKINFNKHFQIRFLTSKFGHFYVVIS